MPAPTRHRSGRSVGPARLPGGLVAALAVAILGTARCGTSTLTTAEPSPVKCDLALAPASTSIDASSQLVSFQVETDPECDWTATTTTDWVTQIAPATGQGPRTVSFRAGANSGPARTGTLGVGREIFTVGQAGGCAYALGRASQEIAIAGGSATVAVSTAAGCSWSATSQAAWIAVTSGSSGSGGGSVAFAVEANTGPPRSGTLTIAGLPFTVTQVSGCPYAITPASQSIGASGGSGAVAVATNAGCAWSAASHVPWIVLTTGATGAGNGSAVFDIQPNPGPARSGTLTIAGQTFPVTQASGCTYGIAPTSHLAGAGGEPVGVAVTTNAGCTWSATSHASWVAVTTGASGTGSGTVAFTVQPNTGPQRNGTLTIAGATFTVTQANGCTYAIAPTSQTVGAAGGSVGVAVTAGNGCTWAATSHAPWIVVSLGPTGSGNGSVVFGVQPNPGPERTGTLTIAGATFTVTQANGCTYAIDPTSRTFTGAGGTGSVTVTTAPGCTWTAISQTPTWIAVLSGSSGSGSGTVQYIVAPLFFGSRAGSILIAGHTFTVLQE